MGAAALLITCYAFELLLVFLAVSQVLNFATCALSRSAPA